MLNPIVTIADKKDVINNVFLDFVSNSEKLSMGKKFPKYQMATNNCALQNTMANNTRDIIDSQRESTRSILDFLVSDKLSTLQTENQNLKLKASQAEQNNYLVSALRPSPVPAYTVPSPYQYQTYGCTNPCGNLY